MSAPTTPAPAPPPADPPVPRCWCDAKKPSTWESCYRARVAAARRAAAALALVGLLALAACVGPGVGTPTPAQVPEALQVVWRGTYEEAGAPPPLLWQYATTCDWWVTKWLPTGDYTGWHIDGVPGCAHGIYYAHDTATVALPGTWAADDYPLSETSFSHELLHAHLERATGDLDPQHTRPEWQAGGLLDEAQDRLRAAGL